MTKLELPQAENNRAPSTLVCGALTMAHITYALSPTLTGS